MKEASGELSMTLITIIAVGVIVGIFAAFWPRIQEAIDERWGRFEEEAGSVSGDSDGDVGMIIVK